MTTAPDPLTAAVERAMQRVAGLPLAALESLRPEMRAAYYAILAAARAEARSEVAEAAERAAGKATIHNRGDGDGTSAYSELVTLAAELRREPVAAPQPEMEKMRSDAAKKSARECNPPPGVTCPVHGAKREPVAMLCVCAYPPLPCPLHPAPNPTSDGADEEERESRMAAPIPFGPDEVRELIAWTTAQLRAIPGHRTATLVHALHRSESALRAEVEQARAALRVLLDAYAEDLSLAELVRCAEEDVNAEHDRAVQAEAERDALSAARDRALAVLDAGRPQSSSYPEAVDSLMRVREALKL